MLTHDRSSRRAFVRSVAGTSFLSLADSVFAKGSIPLAVHGKRPYSIFLSTEASPSERWAAEELQQHVEHMTGIQLPIDIGAGVPASHRVIAVGQSAHLEQLGIEPPGGESCLLATVGETVVIAGGRQRGTMYGVSILLEKLGCRWFTSDVAHIPRIEGLWLTEFHEVHGPAFEYREVFFTEAQGKEWSARNRLNGHFHRLDESVGGRIVYMPFAHAYYDLVPPDRYFASHPEYFSLVQGRRRGDHAQLCLTNTDVLNLAVDQARQWLTTHPDVSIVSISQNDSGGWCECAPCRQVVKEEGGAVSGLALRFVNQVAQRLAASHPTKMVDMLAYQDTADPPSTVRPVSNVQIRLCPIDACQAHSYRSCIYNLRFRERLEQWSRIAAKLYVWQYSINFSHYLAPFPNYDELISDIPAFRRAGISGLFIEGGVSEGGGSDDAELRSYLAARLLWRPDTNTSVEIRGFMDAVYGPAAPLLWDYFALGQQEVRRGQHLWIDQNVDAPYLTSDFLKHGRALLGRAVLKTTSEAARRRVERHLLSIDYVETMRARRFVIQGQFYGAGDPTRAASQVKKLVGTAEELGVTHFREGYPITQQVHDWGDVTARYAGVFLADDAVQATVIPELDGRVVAFGRPNILRIPDPGEVVYPHAGGIFVSLFDDARAESQAIDWQLTSASREAVLLNGKSGPLSDLRMQVTIVGETLRISVTVSNSTASAMRLRLQCTAEFAWAHSQEAKISYRDRSGDVQNRSIRPGNGAAGGRVFLSGGPLPQEEWTIAWAGDPAPRITNRFSAEDMARCGFSWSFRGETGLTISMSVSTPTVELAPGHRLDLASDYRLQGLRPLR
jgi:hypothetical protein